MQPEILFVDDDPDLLAGFQRSLRKTFAIDTALGGQKALELCGSRAPYAVIVADMQMPGMNGIDLLIRLEKSYPDTVRIMLTGNADQKTAREAVNKGHIFRFLNKPCPPEELVAALNAALRQHSLITAERELLEGTLNGAIKVLSEILSIHDPFAFGRGERLQEYMRAFANSLKLSQTWDLELGALLSQLGCVTIPRSVLEKSRSNSLLTTTETDMLTRVPLVGAEMLQNIPRLESVAKIILYQNKNFDGTGFPVDAVAGEEIPVGARILRVLNELLDREANWQSKEKALDAMTKASGKFDGKVLEAVAAGFDICLSPLTADSPVKAVPLDDLHPGAVLKSPAHTKDGVPIAPAGATVTPILLEKLRNFSALKQLAEPILIVVPQT